MGREKALTGPTGFMIFGDSQKTRRDAADLISEGGVIAYRTDTFYGLGADPFNREAVVHLKELKGREEQKPILLLMSNVSDLDRLIVSRSLLFNRLASALWPGPLTIIGQAVNSLPAEVTAGSGTIGVRLPADETVRELLRCCGGILTATSANPSGNPPARTAAEVAGYFPSGLNLIIDGGEVTATEPSTVVDATGDSVEIIREGALSREEIEKVAQR